MIIPVLQNIQFVDKNGYLTDSQLLWLDELIQTMQSALSDNGWTVPNATTAQIATLKTLMPVGTIWFNTDVAKLQVLTVSIPLTATYTVVQITSV